MIDFSKFRRSFQDESITLSSDSLPKNPFELCKNWLQDVQDLHLLDGNAMTLSTASKKGIVSARTVLLKYFDIRGFIFFTNYKSQKAQDLFENPYAALTFYWPTLNRQLNIQGCVEKLPIEESEQYFQSRPRQSQLFAHASLQDERISSLKEVTQKAKKLDQELLNEKIPCPTHWGGFLMNPTAIEFWQGAQGRLNVRFKYERSLNGWQVYQLSP